MFYVRSLIYWVVVRQSLDELLRSTNIMDKSVKLVEFDWWWPHSFRSHTNNPTSLVIHIQNHLYSKTHFPILLLRCYQCNKRCRRLFPKKRSELCIKLAGSPCTVQSLLETYLFQSARWRAEMNPKRCLSNFFQYQGLFPFRERSTPTGGHCPFPSLAHQDGVTVFAWWVWARKRSTIPTSCFGNIAPRWLPQKKNN